MYGHATSRILERESTRGTNGGAPSPITGENDSHFTGTVSQREGERRAWLRLVARGLRKSVGSRSSRGLSVAREHARYRLRARACSHRHLVIFPRRLSSWLLSPGLPVENADTKKKRYEGSTHYFPRLPSLSLLCLSSPSVVGFVGRCLLLLANPLSYPTPPHGLFPLCLSVRAFTSGPLSVRPAAGRPHPLRGKLFSRYATSTAVPADFQWIRGPLAYRVTHR